MSDVQRLKEQLHQVSAEAKHASGGLAGFKLRFTQNSQQVQTLIAGTATGVDQDISEILDAAGKAVESRLPRRWKSPRPGARATPTRPWNRRRDGMRTVLECTDDYETPTVSSVDELVALLDKMAALPRPTWLELASSDRVVLHVGLGREFSSLRFWDDEDVYHSIGTLETPLDAELDFGTVPTRMDTGSAVPVSDARAAVTEFFETAHKPEAVAWKVVEMPKSEADPAQVDGWDAFADPDPN